MEGYKELRVDYNSPTFDSIELPIGLATVVDSEHTRDNESRKSCHCIVGLMNVVAIKHKCKQQKAIALNSTHSETIGTCDVMKETLYVQDIICAFLGIDKDIDSQPCIDSLQAIYSYNKTKTIAVPIHFIHEQIENERVELRKIGTTLNLADSGKKPIPSPTHFRHCDHIIGVGFCPPPDSEHYR